MDGANVSAAEMAACLADLAVVNTVTLARLPTVAFMRAAARRAKGRTLRVVDVACGEGDMLRRLHRWGRRSGVPLELEGIDLSASGIEAARAASAGLPIGFRVADALAPGAFEGADVVLSSLFTHHLAEDQLVAFLRAMEAEARLGWFVNDLHRHAVAYYGFRVLSRAAGWHRFVQHDGPVSVARSFVRADWARMLEAAGVAEVARVRWHVPFRWCVGRLRGQVP